MQQIRAWLARGRAEHGSQALEAAAAALAAALIVLALMAGARTLGPAVEQAFGCAAAVIGGGGGGCGSGQVAVDGTGTPGTNQLTQDTGGFTLLDGLQLGLDVVGLVPGLGELADGANALISLGRGDFAGAALSAAAMIPFAGWAATGGKFARTGVNAADAVNDARRAGNVAETGAEAVVRCAVSAPGGKGPGLAKPLAAKCTPLEIAQKISDDARSGRIKRPASTYHGRLPHDLEADILSNPDAIYASTGKSSRMIYLKGDNIVVVEGTGSARGNVITSYGPDGPRGDSGAAIFGGSASDPGLPVTHDMITNGTIPVPSGGTLPPATQISP